MQIIDGIAIATAMREQIARDIARLRNEGRRIPSLRIIQVGSDAATKVYVRNKLNAAQQVGMDAQCLCVSADIAEEELLQLVRQCNADASIDGFIVQLPLPASLSEERILRAITPDKDVDKHIQQRAVDELLRRAGVPYEGKNVIIIEKNRPLSCTADDVPQGAVVIDMGFTRIDDPSVPKGYRIVGDVDADSIRHKAAYLAPVPGGIGPVIVATLLLNTLEAYQLHS